MKDEKDYIVKWRVKGSDKTYESPFLYTKEEAEHKVEYANEHFTRAHHWMEEA